MLINQVLLKILINPFSRKSLFSIRLSTQDLITETEKSELLVKSPFNSMLS